jgi:hypothetical protein
LVENVPHKESVVPIGTGCIGDIASLPGRQTCHDTVSSTNIKSLTGFSDPVIASVAKQSSPPPKKITFFIFFLAVSFFLFTFAAGFYHNR